MYDLLRPSVPGGIPQAIALFRHARMTEAAIYTAGGAVLTLFC